MERISNAKLRREPRSEVRSSMIEDRRENDLLWELENEEP